MNQLTSTFDKKWTSYALAGGAILIAPMAKGDLITTTQNISLPTTSGSSTVNVDIDGDGQFDYTFFVSDPSVPVGSRETGVEGYGSTTNKIFADPDTFPYGPFATVTSLGSAPDPTSVLKGTAYFLEDGTPKTKGNWNSDITDFQYVGLEFTSSGITYMGWADVSVELDSAGTAGVGPDPTAFLKIDETAYSVVTPEPSSMALMLLGAAGVAALKRRRRSVQ